MSRSTNAGIFLYILKQRRRYDGQTCGKWQKWVSIRYFRYEVEARTYLTVHLLTIRPKVEDAGIFHKGYRLK